MNGGTGDDLMYASPGNDSFIGGGGSDTLDENHATAAITANLPDGVVTGADTDTVSGIANVIGSPFGDT